MTRRDILLVSTADWDNPYWTNKQHVAVELGRMGYKILYIESQGLRRPSATGKDFARIYKRLKRAFKFPRLVSPGVWVWSPIVVPFHGVRWIRSLNRLLLKVGVKFASFKASVRPDILWTYSPLTLDLYDANDYRQVVYHAVDDIQAQPGMPAEAIENGERRLVQRADVVFTTAPNLQDKHSRLNKKTYYFSNVADYDHFNKSTDPALEVPLDLSRIGGPVIGFVGAVSGYKLDFELIKSVAQARPEWKIVFIGEVGEGDPWTDLSTFSDVNNVHFMGGRPYSSLPAYLKGFDVALLPNRINDYTVSMFPMKFFEYLAAGKPVVTTKLPALEDYRGVVFMADGIDEFIKGVEGALENPLAGLDARLAVAKTKTYKSRMIEMMKIVAREQK